MPYSSPAASTPTSFHFNWKHVCALVAAGLYLPLSATTAHAGAVWRDGTQELIVSGGKGLGSALIQQKSIAGSDMLGVNWSYQFYDYPGNHHFQWWAQVSYSHMWIDYQGEDQKQQIWELKPVVRWYPQREAQGLFGEFGIGAAYLTERSFGAIDLSTNLNFSLHFAGGYTLDNGHTVSLRYSHFSNGYTNSPNPGFDFASLNWHAKF
ncbi:acyloxyacyl hydrolase [Microbulbifer elongatus]|uniref:Acyloxyacyl hydrolase n=1 Tax=Microbulbifer elongatus TaxID=86173 RepID=A0ABT1P0H5_9GAMM|nr:acyloxyacyl hydrolase [Microbulbifer elongatus]MCQ3829627.1 acyloxyacyl hydrolase [Microbulbifer elongatus]